jgi:hypothetical protein
MSTGDAFIVRAQASTGVVVRAIAIDGNLDFRDVAVSGGHIAVVGSLRAAISLPGCSLPAGSSGDGIILDFLGSTLACQ